MHSVVKTNERAVENMALEIANMNVGVGVVNTVHTGVPPTTEKVLSVDSKVNLSSGSSRNKYLTLWVGLAVALLVAVPYGVGVGMTMGARGDGSGDSGKSVQANCSSMRNIRIAIAYDSSFCATFGGAVGAKREVERIVAMASTSWYSRPGLCVQLQIVHLEGHCNSETDPYNRGDIESGCNAGYGMIYYFQNYWNAHRSNVSRDAAHLFRTRSFTDWPIGCAYDRSLCNTFAYGVNAFPSNMNAVRRAVLFAHELGHNAGADHVDPTEGDFIMDQLISGGKDGFSKASKDNILYYINSVSCIGTSAAPTTPDDCGSGEIFAEIKFKTDDPAVETSLALTRSDGSVVFTLSNEADKDRASISGLCIPANDCYTVTINDSEGDGTCCGFVNSQGSFEVNIDGQRVGGGGEAFGFQDSVSFGRCSVEVSLSLGSGANSIDTRVTLADQKTGERIWYYNSFLKANTNYSVFGSVDPKGCYVFEATALELGSVGFDLLYDECVVLSAASFGSSLSYAFGEGC
jgi:hypothetical protein